MKKKFMVYGLLAIVLAAALWIFIRGADPGKKPASPNAAREKPITSRSDTVEPPATAGATESGENHRTRPSQLRVTRKYPKPDTEFPIAEPLKDKPGFVLSPYNGTIIELTDIPAGTLIADPNYPPEDKKFFRAP